MKNHHRIMLIHALTESQQPAWDAFARGWPEADIHNLLDDSLASDLAAEGQITSRMMDRFLTLGRYAESTGAHDHMTDAILFTCSAFGPAIDQVKQAVAIPVLRPNEAAFEEALKQGNRIGLIVSFKNSLPPLTHELETMAHAGGQHITICPAVAEGALEALKQGRPDEHDAIVARAAETLRDVDALILCQFSLARAAARIEPVAGRVVYTTPDSAVGKIKAMLLGK